MNAANRQSDESHELRMAVIGYGAIGSLHARAIAEAANASLVAICEVDEQRRNRGSRHFNVPGYESVEELLAGQRLDAVTIATPDHLHVRPALAAIAAGCHVFCEKPMATSVVEAEQIVQAAVERSVQLGVDYNRRFAFGYRTAKRLVDEGAIGMLAKCRLTVHDRTPPPQVARHPLVIFTTLLTHHFDLLRHYGGEIRSLRAVPGTEHFGPLLRDVTLSLELSGGAGGTIVAGYRDDLTRTVEQMELRGSGGRIVVEDIIGPVHLTNRADGHAHSLSPRDHGVEETFDDSLIAHLRAFIDCVTRGVRLPVTGEDGLRGMRLAAAAVESIHSGKSIEVTT